MPERGHIGQLGAKEEAFLTLTYIALACPVVCRKIGVDLPEEAHSPGATSCESHCNSSIHDSCSSLIIKTSRM